MPGEIRFESKIVPSGAFVTVCGTLSLLVHSIMSPFGTDIVDGLKLGLPFPEALSGISTGIMGTVGACGATVCAVVAF